MIHGPYIVKLLFPIIYFEGLCILFYTRLQNYITVKILQCQRVQPGKCYSDVQKANAYNPRLNPKLWFLKFLPFIWDNYPAIRIISTKSALLAVTTLPKETCETPIKLSRYLEIDDWPQRRILITERVRWKKSQQFGFSRKHCVRTCGEFRNANGNLGFARLQKFPSVVNTL